MTTFVLATHNEGKKRELLTILGPVLGADTQVLTAAEAGLAEGDLIIGVDDTTVGGAGALTGAVRGLEVGSTHQLEVVRDGGIQQVEVTLSAREG